MIHEQRGRDDGARDARDDAHGDVRPHDVIVALQMQLVIETSLISSFNTSFKIINLIRHFIQKNLHLSLENLHPHFCGQIVGRCVKSHKRGLALIAVDGQTWPGSAHLLEKVVLIGRRGYVKMMIDTHYP